MIAKIAAMTMHDEIRSQVKVEGALCFSIYGANAVRRSIYL